MVYKHFPSFLSPDLIFVVSGDSHDAHTPHSLLQGARPAQRVPGPQHRVQDANQEGEGEFAEEIRQEAGSE